VLKEKEQRQYTVHRRKGWEDGWVLKEKEQRQYGEFRTRRLVLEAWERLQSSRANKA
jgi:hypothetical protein